MRTDVRVAMRFLTGRAAPGGYLDEDISNVFGTVKQLRKYAATLVKARDLLQSVIECLRSKPLDKVYVDLKQTIEQVPNLIGLLESIVANLSRLDDQLTAEERRQTALVNAGGEDYELDVDQVAVPGSLLKAIQTQVDRYTKLVETTFDKSFSIDEIGTAGSAALKTYERLLEKADGWEECNLPDINLDADDLADAIADRALEAAE